MTELRQILDQVEGDIMQDLCKMAADDPGLPPIVKAAMARLARQLHEPPAPALTAEEFTALDPARKGILTCNMPGCGQVVSTHGLLCVEHLCASAKP